MDLKRAMRRLNPASAVVHGYDMAKKVVMERAKKAVIAKSKAKKK